MPSLFASTIALLVQIDPTTGQSHQGVAATAPERGKPCAEYCAAGSPGVINAELVVGEVFVDLDVLLNPPGYQARLLFPGDDAQLIQSGAASDDSLPLLLVVPDGTWRKARKLLHLNPLLAQLPRVTLPEGAVSRYRLRKAPGPGALSTLEAIVQALEILEAPTSFAPLLRPFEALIEGQIEAMGAQTYQRNHLSTL